MRKSILITGASGFVGSHLVDEGLKRGYHVIAGVREGSSRKYLSDGRLDFAITDLFELQSMERSLKKLGSSNLAPSYIVHNAGITKSKTETGFYRGNRDASIKFFEMVQHFLPSVEKVLFVSSLSAQGPIDNTEILIHNELPENPMTPYGKSKLAGERGLREMMDINHLIFRPTAIYGPRETKMLQLTKIILKGLEPDFSPKNQKLSFIHVYDLVRLMYDAAESNHQNKIYLVSDGRTYSMDTYRNIIKQYFNKRTFRIRVSPKILLQSVQIMNQAARWAGRTMHTTPEKIKDITALNWSVDVKPLEDDFNFKAQFPLEKGLPQTLSWYKKNNWL